MIKTDSNTSSIQNRWQLYKAGIYKKQALGDRSELKFLNWISAHHRFKIRVFLLASAVSYP